MPITQVGTLPVGGINVGLNASLAAFDAEVAKLSADISGLNGAVTTQAQFQATFPPPVAGYTAMFATLDTGYLTAAFNPATWASLNAGFNADLVAELGVIETQIAAVGAVTSQLRGGIDSGSLAGWTYAGRARGFGRRLQSSTTGGFGGIDRAAAINAIIIATENFQSWGGFAGGFNAADSAAEDLGATTTEERLKFQGVLSAGDWSDGAEALLAQFNAFLLELEGAKAELEAQIQLTLGANLPDPGVVFDALGDVDIGAAIGSLVDVEADIGADIGSIQANVDASLSAKADITADLSGGGLTLWSYSGPAGELGEAFAAEVENGLPGSQGGPSAATYGLVLATASPAVWAGFGTIFKTS